MVLAEMGLVRFTRLTLEVCGAVLSAQRTRFSKRQFTQLQLSAALCLIRYEARAFRDAEVRLGGHAELRSALKLSSVHRRTTLYRFLARQHEEDVARVQREIMPHLPGVGKAPPE